MRGEIIILSVVFLLSYSVLFGQSKRSQIGPEINRIILQKQEQWALRINELNHLAGRDLELYFTVNTTFNEERLTYRIEDVVMPILNMVPLSTVDLYVKKGPNIGDLESIIRIHNGLDISFEMIKKDLLRVLRQQNLGYINHSYSLDVLETFYFMQKIDLFDGDIDLFIESLDYVKKHLLRNMDPHVIDTGSLIFPIDKINLDEFNRELAIDKLVTFDKNFPSSSVRFDYAAQKFTDAIYLQRPHYDSLANAFLIMMENKWSIEELSSHLITDIKRSGTPYLKNSCQNLMMNMISKMK